MNQININELLNKALALHHQGKLDDADKIYQLVINSDENNFQANHLHGCILSQQLHFDEAINLYPDSFETLNNIAGFYLEEEMEKFLFGEGSVAPEGFVPEKK